jgi:hypothetical protein
MGYVDVHKKDLSKAKITDLKRIADYWFRQYLLSKANRNKHGSIYCPLIRKWVHESQIHVCHFIDRQKGRLRYSEENCILASAYTNTVQADVRVEGYKSLHHKLFAAYLGEERVKYLNEKAKELLRRDKVDYITLISKYKNTVDV